MNEEIAITEPVVETARKNAAEHLQRAQETLRLDGVTLERYKDFLNATMLVAESTIAHCRKLASIQEIPLPESTQIVQGLMQGVRESARTLYVVMATIEQMATRAEKRDLPQARTLETVAHDVTRACAFCGKTAVQTKLVAGPAGNICASCTRSACGVLGIGLSDNTIE